MCYVEAESYYAGMLGRPLNCMEYKEWAKGALMDLFFFRT